MYYDHIPLLSSSTFNTHFYSIDRVDVLRGPQATLYGMNSEGGLVRIYSKNPMNYQGTDISMGIATGLQRHAEVAHYQRPSDALAFSAAAFYQGQRGFIDNDHLGRKNDKMDEAGGKLRLVWAPSDRLTADATADYQFTTQNAFPYGILHTETNTVDNPASTFMNGYRRNMLNAGLTLAYRANRLLITSTTSYQHLYDHMDMDQDYSPADRMALHQHQRQNAVTEELTLRSHSNSRWQHTTGIFAAWQHLLTSAPVTFGADMRQTLATAIKGYMEAAMANVPMAHAFTRFDMPQFYVNGQYTTPRLNAAAFHESTVRLSDRLTATLGLRLDHSRVKLEYEADGMMDFDYDMSMMGRNITGQQHIADSLCNNTTTHFTQLLPKVGLTWELDSKGSNVYALFSKGYRSGGFNIQGFSEIIQPRMMAAGRNMGHGDTNLRPTDEEYATINDLIKYDPETSFNYEAGTHLNLFDGTLQADISTFYMLVRNQQLSVMAGNSGYGRMVVNAGKSSSCGIEAALRAVALDGHLQWAATYSYTHATFREYQDTETTANATATIDYKDKRLPYVPAHLFSALADYRFDLSDDGMLRTLTLGLNVTGNGKTYWDAANTASQNFYAVLGAHACLGMGALTIDLWGRNLTQTEYTTFGLASTTGNFYIGQRALPLQVGCDLRLHF